MSEVACVALETLTAVGVAEDEVVENASSDSRRNIRQRGDRGVGSTRCRGAPESKHSEAAAQITC